MTQLHRIPRTLLLASAVLLAAGCSSNSSSAPNTAPSVLTTGPADAATGVPRNPSISATFSEPMNATTLNTATFVVMNGATAVPGTVTYIGNTVTFVPTNALAPNTVFTATISTGATDMAGGHMAAAKTWHFTTVATGATGPAAVNLGTAGNYVILTKSGISTTGVTAIVGDIGVSPIAASGITGFALSAPPTTFSTSLLVTGKVWAADYAVPTPANLTTAVLDMQTAYTDAAGRTLPDFTELGAGNITGQTLAPGLYKWGTGVSLSGSGAVTLNGDANLDASVNVLDLNSLLPHFNSTGVWTGGDFNYDSSVNVLDLNLLLPRFNTSLPSISPAATTPIAASSTQPPAATAISASSLFAPDVSSSPESTPLRNSRRHRKLTP